MNSSAISIRTARPADLEEINRIISACVMGWNLPERVKRLSMISYHYDEQDLNHLQVMAAVDRVDGIVGVAALEPAVAADIPENNGGLLLHGLYIRPDRHKRGIGKLLLDCSMRMVANSDRSGLLVKAQADANSYFARQGFEKRPVTSRLKDYPHRWWKHRSGLPGMKAGEHERSLQC